MNHIGRTYGHIRVERMLGQGGMGHVYEGFDEKLARRVALKLLPHDVRLDAEARARLTREARTLGRLDHPNICRIYDFIDADDADVLVLELIDGVTLQQAIRNGLARTEKLRIAEAIADVLVAAHRAGIIHRDLKPENVMLTKSGEVKVLDFGLARWIERERRSSAGMRAVAPGELAARLHVREAEDEWFALADIDATAKYEVAVVTEPAVNATAAGITVGTPLYMSPEQARGEPLTPASDIYSFGLLLQSLFTEKDAYPEGASAREVMLKAARGESLPVTGVPHEIAALIKALKAFAPSDRLTAADALARLRWIIDTPKRYIRRATLALVLVVVAFAGWKYVTDLRRERTVAQQAEAEARRRRAQADSLIGFMLGDLRQKLEPVGRLDILDAVAERSLAYMSSLDPKQLSAEELARNSKALYQLGEVRMAQGNLAAAVGVFNQSLKLAVAAHQRDPLDPKLDLAVGTAHFWVGNALRVKGDLPGALTEMMEYRRIAEDLAKRYPNVDEYQLERAYGHSTVGVILEDEGHLDAAVDAYKTTLAIKSALLALDPNNAKRQADVAVTLSRLGLITEQLGRIGEALQDFDRERSIYESLSAADAKNTHWQDRIANSSFHIAGILEMRGDAASAVARYDAAVALYRKLSELDPTNSDWQRNLAFSEASHADTLRGRSGESLRELSEAEGILKRLIARDPSRRAWQLDLAAVRAKTVQALLDSHDVSAAVAKSHDALALLPQIPRSGIERTVSAMAYLVAGDVEEMRHDAATSMRYWRNGYDALLPLLGSQPSQRRLAIAATLLLRLHRDGEAQPLIARLTASGCTLGPFERRMQHPE